MHRYIARGLAAEMLMGRHLFYVALSADDAERALLEVWSAVGAYKRHGSCSLRNSAANRVITHRSGGYVRILSSQTKLEGYQGDTVIVQAARDELSLPVLARLLAIGPAEFLP